jgi:hypothetical protein
MDLDLLELAQEFSTQLLEYSDSTFLTPFNSLSRGFLVHDLLRSPKGDYQV